MVIAIGLMAAFVALRKIQTGPGGASGSPAATTESAATEVAAPAPKTGAMPAVSSHPPKPASDPGATAQANPVAANTTSPQAGTAPPSIVATTPEQDRMEANEKDMDKLKEALLDGGSDPALLTAVRERLVHKDSDVRKAAVETIVNLNDAGAIPQLQEALAKTEDAREKVAIMDAIEYLQTPQGDPQFTAEPAPSGPAPVGGGASRRQPSPSAKQPAKGQTK
jgi:hypothetical protein